jgi:glycosyltransferase involved in cell wall biosynthesis
MVKKIAHLSSAHGRYDSRIFDKETRTLAEAGYDVHLVIADGKPDELIHGVQIHNVSKKKPARLQRILFTTFLVFLKARSLKADIYHFHDPELLFTGFLLKFIGKKVIYDIHENTSLQIKTKTWIPRVIRGTVSKSFSLIEHAACRLFDGLCVPQPSMKSHYSQLNGNTRLIANFVKVRPLEPFDSQDKTIIFHPGALSRNRGLFNMLDVLEHLDNTELVIAGAFESASVEEEAKAHNAWPNVRFLGNISQNEVLEWYQRTTIGLILYDNIGQYYLSYAIKLFEYMERGIPVIMPDFGEWVDFNELNNCGLNVNVNVSTTTAAKIAALIQNPTTAKQIGQRGRKAIEQTYNWKVAGTELLDLYKVITN